MIVVGGGMGSWAGRRIWRGPWRGGLQDGGGVHPYSFGDDVFRLGGHGYESLFWLSLCEG